MHSKVLMSCFLLEVLAALVSTLILILPPLKGCSHVDEWWKYLGFEAKQVLYGEGERIQSPRTGAVLGRWEGLKIKETHCIVKLKKKVMFILHPHRPCPSCCAWKRFFTLVFLLLCLLGFWSLFLFGYFLSWKKEMELERDKESLLGVLLYYWNRNTH